MPPQAHFDALLCKATAPNLPQQLDRAIGAIELKNVSLSDVLYREFSRLALKPGKPSELMGLVARLPTHAGT